MPRGTKTNPVWQQVLRVPPRHVATVARLIRFNRLRIEGYYDGVMEEFPENCRPGKIQVSEVTEDFGCVIVTVQGKDVRPNAVTEALKNAIPADLGVGFPTWS
jgi:hypothetical protein